MKRENNSKSGKQQNKLNKRREEAEIRNANWQTLTPRAQLVTLDERPGESKRQKERIRAKLNK